ncbi:MAG: PLP-dependent aminotransferase family protein [Mesorhizobium sp.]|nr:MAG: PLP-dependent aminotransferase family protein [Mesorhizobium sp.]
MTNWLPDLSSGSGPLYQRLADSIESDIDKGVIDAGSKLPPQRDLAYDIGTTVGTIGRAYQLLRERGLVSGEVGRGTYVLAQRAETPKAEIEPAVQGTRPIDVPTGKLRFDSTAAPDVGQGAVIADLLARTAQEHPHDISSYTRDFPERWYEAGSRWLSRNSFRPSSDSIVPTLGTHAAVIAAIAALTTPGDYVVFEHLTYSQISRSAGLIGRRTALVSSDDEGIDPEDFERVCAQKHPKMMFVMPTAKNPTLVTMPEARRQAVARIAREYNVVLIEDDLYGDLTDDPTPLLAEYAPERTIVAGGLSKAEVGSRLVMSGQAGEIRKRCIAEIQARTAIVRDMLAGFNFRARDNVPFVWLTLPDPWLSGTFKNACLEHGVLIDDEDEFKAGRSEQVFHGVRFGVSQPRQSKEVASGVAVIRRLLDEGRAGYDSFS